MKKQGKPDYLVLPNLQGAGELMPLDDLPGCMVASKITPIGGP